MHSSLAVESIGARASATGLASHHQTEAMIVSETKRSASGVRAAIGLSSARLVDYGPAVRAANPWEDTWANATPDRDSKLRSSIKAAPFNNK
jgi:hypothetical protein